jgi:hypothetical protein
MTSSDIDLGRYGPLVGEFSGTWGTDVELWPSDVNLAVPAHGGSLWDRIAFVQRNSGVVIAGRMIDRDIADTDFVFDDNAVFFLPVGPGRVDVEPYWFAGVPVPRYGDLASEQVFPSSASAVVSESVQAAAGTALDRGWTLLEERLFSAFTELVREAGGETFFDGMDNAFRSQTIRAIEFYGDVAIYALEQAIGDPSANVEVVEEALRLLGDVEDNRTEYSRLSVLLKALTSTNARVRDAASVGLASLGNPVAKDSLRAAMAREVSDQLRRNLESALLSL